MNPPFSLTSSFAAPRRLKAGPWSLPVSMYGRLRRGVDRRRRRRWLERRHYGGYGGYGPSRRAERRRYYTRAEGFAAATGCLELHAHRTAGRSSKPFCDCVAYTG